MRCLALFTGGLDSQLAVRLMQRQGIAVRAIYFRSAWSDATAAATAAAGTLDVPLAVADLGEKYVQSLRQPRFGYAFGAAPCLDCRIAMLSEARCQLEQQDAEFVVTGEVVGQRVRSAVRDLEIVAHHAGLEGRLLRPLSARLLPATECERSHCVDRARLFDWQGKSRRPQAQLAAELGLAVAPPRPDCPLLSGPLAERALALVRSGQGLRAWDLELLAIGRHEAVGGGARVIVGRNEHENERLTATAAGADAGNGALVFPVNFLGPTALLIGAATEANVQRAAALVARYSRNMPASPRLRVETSGVTREIELSS